MKFLKSFMLYLLTITFLSASLHSSATTELKWFDPEKPYEDIPVVSIEYVCADEHLEGGHCSMTGENTYSVITNIEQVKKLKQWWPDWYDMDSSFWGLSSLNEQLTKYDDAYFNDYFLLLINEEDNFRQTDEGRRPKPIPVVHGLYLQNNRIFVDDRNNGYFEPHIEGDPLEYYTFITIDRELYEKGLKDVAFGFLSEQSHSTPQAPQTSDPTTALTVTAAVSLTALCLLPVVGKKRRQR